MASQSIRTIWVIGMLLLGSAVSAADAAGDAGDVRRVVQDWAAAWSAGRFNEYAAYYVEDFAGKAESNAAWRAQRRARIDGRRDLRVALGPILVRLNKDDPDLARAVFLQSYQSNSWCDVTEKTLSLRRSALGWRIFEEQSVIRNRC